MYLTCPTCGKPLAPETRWRIPLDVCSGCGAIWLDPGEFGPYLQQADARAGATSDPRFRKVASGLPLMCPACRTKTLTSWEARDIRILACSKCRGVLLPVSQAMRLRASPRPKPTGPRAETELAVSQAMDDLDELEFDIDLIRILLPDR